MPEQNQELSYHLHASTFQKPLVQLAEVLAQKVKREAPKLLAAPLIVSADLHVLVRQAMHTYDLLFYLNADERRETDYYWRNAYSIVTLPLVRNMIDCLYNITAILQDPKVNGPWFRKSGYRKMLEALDEDQARYAGRPDWDRWIKQARDGLDLGMRADGFTEAEVRATAVWPTLGRYTSNKQPGGTFTPHQDFLKTFVLGRWKEYSAMAHGAFEGLMLTAMYYISDGLPHEARPNVDAQHSKILSSHIARAAVVLLCIITELQAHFRFDDDGARINERIDEMWNALMPASEVKELYDERYAQLMKDRGINPALGQNLV